MLRGSPKESGLSSFRWSDARDSPNARGRLEPGLAVRVRTASLDSLNLGRVDLFALGKYPNSIVSTAWPTAQLEILVSRSFVADVEAMEIEVLDGALELLRRHRPIVQAEANCNPGAHHNTSCVALDAPVLDECPVVIDPAQASLFVARSRLLLRRRSH